MSREVKIKKLAEAGGLIDEEYLESVEEEI